MDAHLPIRRGSESRGERLASETRSANTEHDEIIRQRAKARHFIENELRKILLMRHLVEADVLAPPCHKLAVRTAQLSGQIVEPGAIEPSFEYRREQPIDRDRNH